MVYFKKLKFWLLGHHLILFVLLCSRKRRLGMVRLLGMRLLTRLLLLICSLSLISLLFLSRCGLNNLEPETEEQDTQAALQGKRFIERAILNRNLHSKLPVI